MLFVFVFCVAGDFSFLWLVVVGVVGVGVVAAAVGLPIGFLFALTHARTYAQNLPPEWEKILNESGITADEQEQSSGTVIQVLNAAANIKTKGLGRAPRPT